MGTPMIDLNNTKVAFKIKTDKELSNARFLFTLIKYPWIVSTLGGMSQLAMKIHFPIGWAVKPTLYRHFVGGETIEECLPIMHRMYAEKVGSILDYSVEAAEKEEAVEATFNEVLRSVQNTAAHDGIPFSVFKPTALTIPAVLKKVSDREPLSPSETASFQRFKERIAAICVAAVQAGKPVMIDAEDCWYQPAIDEVAEEMMQQYNKEQAYVYTTLQMYRTDRIDYLHALIERAKREGFLIGVKYVRGAYMERERRRAAAGGYPSPIHANKAATDRDFNEALRISIENKEQVRIFCGTHNEESVLCLVHYMQQHGMANNDPRVFFSQLYGMSDNLSFNLAQHGYNVAKYLPYGKMKDVLPYLIRRAEENSAIAGQTTRELLQVKDELKRRKQTKA